MDAHLLHDAGLALGEGDVPTRLVLDELDLDLAALTAALLVVIVIVVGGGAGALALGATALDDTAVLEVVVLLVRRVWVLVDDLGRLNRTC